MRKRHGFTLVELLVTMALIIMIMVILAETLGTALNIFHQLKAIGDMQERLRAATAVIRRDLTADHFEGKRRLSDGSFDGGRPLKGFFRLYHRPVPIVDEGPDMEGISSVRAVGDVLHFTVKLRGNNRDDMFVAPVPAGSPLLPSSGMPTNFFGQPGDALYWDDQMPTYRSQWAEVAYFLMPVPNYTTVATAAQPNGLPLHALYRAQFLVVPNTQDLNRAGARAAATGYEHISYQRGSFAFNSPEDLADPNGSPARALVNRTFDPSVPTLRGATLLLTDVVSFHVGSYYEVAETQQIVVNQQRETTYTGRRTISWRINEQFDTLQDQYSCRALRITLRIWDIKTRQTRQVSFVQDM